MNTLIHKFMRDYAPFVYTAKQYEVDALTGDQLKQMSYAALWLLGVVVGKSPYSMIALSAAC